MLSFGTILFALGLGVAAFGFARHVMALRSGRNGPRGVSLLSRLAVLAGWIPRFLAPGWTESLRPGFLQKTKLAGLDERIWTAEAMIGAKILAMCAGMAFWFAVFQGWQPATRLIAGAGLGWWYAGYRLKIATRQRQQRIDKGLPYVLDLLHLCVHSGLGFDMALRRIATVLQDGPIREEFGRVINAVSFGSGLSAAFRELGTRIASHEGRAVVLALVQAVDRGAQIGDTLKVQAEQLRFSRLMAVEEQVHKLPTRMTVPMILFFMPCMIIVVIGPVVISTYMSYRGY